MRVACGLAAFFGSSFCLRIGDGQHAKRITKLPHDMDDGCQQHPIEHTRVAAGCCTSNRNMPPLSPCSQCTTALPVRSTPYTQRNNVHFGDVPASSQRFRKRVPGNQHLEFAASNSSPDDGHVSSWTRPALGNRNTRKHAGAWRRQSRKQIRIGHELVKEKRKRNSPTFWPLRSLPARQGPKRAILAPPNPQDRSYLPRVRRLACEAKSPSPHFVILLAPCSRPIDRPKLRCLIVFCGSPSKSDIEIARTRRRRSPPSRNPFTFITRHPYMVSSAQGVCACSRDLFGARYT